MTSQSFKWLRPTDAAFVCFASTTLVFSPNTSIFRDTGGGDFIAWFVYPMFAGMVAAALAAFAVARRRPGHALSAKARFACALAYALGCAGFGALSLANYPAGALPALAGLACGAAFVPVACAWARRLARLDFRQALAASCLACAGAAVLASVLTFLPAAPKMALYCTAVLVGALAPCLPRGRRAATPSGANAEGESMAATNAESSGAAGMANAADSAALTPEGATAGLLQALRLPAAGLLLYAFVMAITKSQAFGLFDREFAGGVAAALVIVPLFFVRTSGPLPSLVYRIVVPAFGGLAILLISLPAAWGFADAALSVVYVFLSALAILALANVIALLHAAEYDCVAVVGMSAAAGGIASLLGLLVANSPAAPQDFTPIVFAMVALYVAFLLVSLGVDSWRMVQRPADEAVPQPERGTAPTQADPLAWLAPENAALLSNREREILAYWCRGHSVIYIAEKLFISESTVRTHVKHIYAKLGIHSREELLEAAAQEA